MPPRTVCRIVLVCLALILGPRPAWAPVLPVQDHPIPPPSQTHWNDFGANGEKCPGACGAGCPDNCRKEPFKRCHPDGTSRVVSGDAFTCGTSESCSAYEDCQATCQSLEPDDRDLAHLIFGIRPAYAPLVPVEGPGEPDFGDASCQNLCDTLAGGSASSHSLGYGPYDGAATWEYSQPNAGAPESAEDCGPCETCRNGECVRDPQACPEPPGEPGNEPPAPPGISTGDVHLTSLDRLRFGFQAVGEFLLVEDEDGDLVVQFRTRPSGNRVSVNSAAAMQVAGDVVGVYMDPERRLLVNGEPAMIEPEDSLDLDNGGTIRRLTRNRYRVEWPDSSVIEVVVYSSNLSIRGILDDGRAGRVRGVAGDFDGDTSNDIRSRDGRIFDRKMSHEERYDIYADSWRISQQESLFDYRPGETTETFTDRTFPSGYVDLASVDPEALALAEEACADIGHPRHYRDCLLDVAVTGDTELAEAHRGEPPPESEVPVTYIKSAPSGDIEIDTPASVPAGAEIIVSWSGTRRIGDYVSVADPNANITEHRTYRVVRMPTQGGLYAPEMPGTYVIRYIQGNEIATEKRIEITPVEASLDAPDAVPSGSEVEITWEGPGNHRDYVAIADPGDPGGRYHAYRYTRSGSPLPLTVPEEAGTYELRYVLAQSKSILASRQIEITPVEASLDAPDAVPSGSEVEVTWEGPGNHRDYVAIADPGDPGGRYHAYRYTRSGSPLPLTVPEEAGTYELRYVLAQSKSILASRQIEITPVEASLDAPDAVPSGSEVKVAWEGPGNHRDYVAIADPGDPGGRYHAYRYTRSGSPLPLTVPEEAGTYELRYVLAQSKSILASRQIEITPVEASLDAPDAVPSGSEVEVTWEGPGNHRDYVAIADPGDPGGRYHAYRYTRSRSPLPLTVPDEPGTYEIRYVQAQSKTILARRKLIAEPPD